MSGTAGVLVLHADREPRAGVANRGPRDTYRNPRLRIEERALGAVAPGCVRVEMVYAGVCGTDVHTAAADPDTGYVVGSAQLEVGPAGRVLGHEGVGRVVEVGERAGTLRRGELVTFESLLHCHA